MTWAKRAEQFLAVAEEAKAAGDDVVMIVALQRAAECVQIARTFEKIDAALDGQKGQTK